MIRLEQLAAWFFSGLAIACVIAAVLVVPANAFADAGTDCATQCASAFTVGTSQYCTCLGGCCGSACQYDSYPADCGASCCVSACTASGGSYSDCMNGCMAVVPLACSSFNCGLSCTPCPVTDSFPLGAGCWTDCTYPQPGVVLCRSDNCCLCFDLTPKQALPTCSCKNQ
jgi:hypothetical protein